LGTPGGVAQFFRVGLIVIVALTVCACGEDVQPLSEESGSLPPGRYSTTAFQPALSFEIGDGWKLAGPEGSQLFGIAWEELKRDGNPTIYFIHPPSTVYDPRNPDELAPAPEDWVSWFRGHPRLDMDEPEQVSIGGAEGQRIGMGVGLLPEDYYSTACAGRYVPLWPIPDGAWCAIEGTVDQIIVLEDVEGKTVIIDVGGPAGTFEEFLPQAQKVLDTVEWEGS
jgi:hypothetical protein